MTGSKIRGFHGTIVAIDEGWPLTSHAELERRASTPPEKFVDAFMLLDLLDMAAAQTVVVTDPYVEDDLPVYTSPSGD